MLPLHHYCLCWAVSGMDRENGCLVPEPRQGASPVKSGALRLVTIVTLNTAPLGSPFCLLTLFFLSNGPKPSRPPLRSTPRPPRSPLISSFHWKNPSSPTLCFPPEHCLPSCHRLLLWHLHNRLDHLEINMLIKNWKFSSPWEQGKLNFKSSVEVRWNICISSFQGRQGFHSKQPKSSQTTAKCSHKRG